MKMFLVESFINVFEENAITDFSMLEVNFHILRSVY